MDVYYYLSWNGVTFTYTSYGHCSTLKFKCTAPDC